MSNKQSSEGITTAQVSWNKGKLIGQKPPLKREAIWAVRIRLQIAGKVRDLALFNLAIDSKLRGGVHLVTVGRIVRGAMQRYEN